MKVFAISLCMSLHISMSGQFPAGSKNVTLTPTSFSNMFSLNMQPVLRIRPGDTVATETIDAAGFDKNRIKRQKGGNPLTGPFYIESSSQGDILAITITKLSLNRLTAFTTESFTSRSLHKSLLPKNKKLRLVTWQLDTLNGYAVLDDSSYQNARHYKVPVKPFLGCIGVAPSNKKNEVLSFFEGSYGGNLDFESITQSATIYLPVFHEGAYLYVGDGHALQGNGEITGNALETSLDVAFTVKILKGSQGLSAPRVEDSTWLMSVGIAKNLDDALKNANGDLLHWLQQDYHLSVQEATQVMSTTIEYTIAEIADPNVEVVAKMKKEFLNTLKRGD